MAADVLAHRRQPATRGTCRSRPTWAEATPAQVTGVPHRGAAARAVGLNKTNRDCDRAPRAFCTTRHTDGGVGNQRQTAELARRPVRVVVEICYDQANSSRTTSCKRRGRVLRQAGALAEGPARKGGKDMLYSKGFSGGAALHTAPASVGATDNRVGEERGPDVGEAVQTVRRLDYLKLLGYSEAAIQTGDFDRGLRLLDMAATLEGDVFASSGYRQPEAEDRSSTSRRWFRRRRP